MMELEEKIPLVTFASFCMNMQLNSYLLSDP